MTNDAVSVAARKFSDGEMVGLSLARLQISQSKVQAEAMTEALELQVLKALFGRVL